MQYRREVIKNLNSMKSLKILNMDVYSAYAEMFSNNEVSIYSFH